MLRAKSWRWLRARIIGLLSRPHGHLVLGHDAEFKPVTAPLYANRVQAALADPHRATG